MFVSDVDASSEAGVDASVDFGSDANFDMDAWGEMDGMIPSDMTTIDMQSDATVDATSDDASIDAAEASVEAGADAETIAAVLVDAGSDLTTTELGGTAAFSLSLSRAPIAPVQILIASSDATEGVSLTASVTFTSADFATPQFVTLRGVDDLASDGPVTFNVSFTVVSVDPAFDGLTVASLSVVNVDDETSSVIVTPTTGLTTSEAGATASISVRVSTAPSADVSMTVTSSDPSEGVVEPTTLRFTRTNWMVPQTVVVTGVDDDALDGDQDYEIVVGAPVSLDASYAGIAAEHVSVTNVDDEAAFVLTVPASGLLLRETGPSATVYVVLSAAPASDVVFDVTSSNENEAEVNPGVVTFTAANWDVPQPILVTPGYEMLVDGDQPFSVDFGVTRSVDPDWDGRIIASVSGTNQDVDVAGIDVAFDPIAVVTEAGSTVNVAVHLTHAAIADVSMDIESLDVGEFVVAPATLTIPAGSTDGSIAVTGVSDGVVDGDQIEQLVVHPATSTVAAYNGLDPYDVAVRVIDVDPATCVTCDDHYVPTSTSGSRMFGNSMSRDGRYVAYADHYAYLRDRENGSLDVVSRANGVAGDPADDDTFSATVSANGRYVCYASYASNLAAGSAGHILQLYVRDMTSATNTRVSVANDGAIASMHVDYWNCGVSDDGRYVAFTHSQALAPTDLDTYRDVFVRDTVMNTTTLVSVNSMGTPAPDPTSLMNMSSDGRFVLMHSWSALAASDVNATADLYLRDRMLGTTVPVSVNAAGVPIGAAAGWVSDDGNVIAFSTTAAVLPSDTNGLQDVYVRDRALGTTTLVSVSSSGVVGNGLSGYGDWLTLSSDGRYVAFVSIANNLVTGDLLGFSDAFVRDRTGGTTRAVSFNAAGEWADADTYSAAISLDGSTVLFSTGSSNLEPYVGIAMLGASRLLAYPRP